MATVELWGGAECTVNRVGDAYCDQTRLSGHQDRLEDLDRFAELGLAAIRYPVLWERIAPGDSADADWRWTDARLQRLRALGIRPIAGLVHHGSGPRHTNLLDDVGFAAGLGRFAGQVAERYPWIEDWTPVNEPLTTARFSALYGHWYPHARDERSFWRAVLNQVDGVRAAMRAIRRVNPSARLIQTDDLGRTYATLPLAEQAAYDNLRRWAGWDLLFGRVTRLHPLWERLARLGLADRLRAIVDDPCPPDVVGVNHYLTSDRFLDHRLQLYPAHLHGGNGRRAYADTEAVRVIDPPPAGLAGALTEAWQRYRTPIAATEVHNGCTREEQLRWAAEAWDTATSLNAAGVEVRAVTAWALLGSYGWDRLLTAPGRYETGVFDVAGGTPRPTALARLWRGLPEGAPRHPAAAATGWWRRPERLLHPPLVRPAAAVRSGGGEAAPGLLILGATGTLGQAFARACTMRGLHHRLLTRSELDLHRPDLFAAVLDRLRPWGVINAAGWVRVDDAEAAEAACHAANATGAVALARACAERGIANLAVSSHLVFDGDGDRPYRESDRPRPGNAYGRSKAALEAGCAGLPETLVVRTAAFFSLHDSHNFADAVATALARGQRFAAAADQVVSPTFVPGLVDHALDLLIDGAEGVWHLAGDQAMSWADFGRAVAVACGLDPALILAAPGATLGQRASRPRYSAMTSERGAPAIPFADAIARFAHERTAHAARKEVMMRA
jgi:dTDP-4-dehydrorhamnose reductase